MRRIGLLLVAALLAAVPATARASVQQESTFQDDDLLVFGSADAQAQTLDTLKSLGVDRVRVSVFWYVVAPDPKSRAKPGFDAADPAAYPAANWERYDRLVRLAQARGLALNFDLTGPAPLWATGTPERQDIASTYDPSPGEFGAFATAVAKRYAGDYAPPAPGSAAPPPESGGPLPCPPACTTRATQASAGQGALPRVDYWSIWNEPNQAGWLTPQWTKDAKGWAEAAPRIYRGLADAAWAALQATGHGQDTILVGETAPKGLVNNRGTTRSLDALRFLRALYCVDARFRPLSGAAATRRGCPDTPAASARFADDHPALFGASGWAHHPYELIRSPHTAPEHGDWVTIGNLPRLSSTLERTLRRYGRPRPGGMPLYLTEYGYQTNPPDRFGVSWATQAAYLDESEFRAYVNPQVRTLAQFLLHDGGNPVSLTFQSGLMTVDGRPKPSMDAYRLPLYLPQRSFSGKQRLRVWGLVRPAPNGRPTQATVEFRSTRGRAWRVLRTMPAEAGRGYVDGRVRVPGSGSVRLRWGNDTSREVSVRRRP